MKKILTTLPLSLLSLSFVAVLVLLLTLWAPITSAYNEYSTGPDGSCADCHGDFRANPYISLADGVSWGDDLHDVHRNTMLSGDCNTCHSSGRSPVFLDSSNGGNGLAPISCSGCHGRDEDAADGSGSGDGLRAHHASAGVAVCATCHTTDTTPVGENVLPPYYFTPDTNHPNKPTDPCNPLGEEDYKGSTIGLDNDGDGLYDQADSDCLIANTPPVANDDAASTPFQTAATINVLGNDTDADGDTLNVDSVTNGSNGFVINNGTNVTYTPNTGFSGIDSFTYLAFDGTDVSNLATVTVTVAAPPNVPPTANANGPYIGTVGIPVSFSSAGSTDSDGTIASYAWDFGDGSTSTLANPSHTYASAIAFTVSLTVTDDGGLTGSDSTTATIAAANVAPVANDNSYATDEDTLLNVGPPGVLGNDTDADGDLLTAVLVADVSNGTLALNANGDFSYTPNLNFNGSDSFTYLANDGVDNSLTAATVTITVNAINDAPVANDDAATTPFETPVTIDVLANDVDIDGDTLVVNSFNATSVNGAAVSCTTTCTYTPVAGFSGDDTFTYDATDGALVSNRATVTVTVEAAAVIDLDVAQFRVTKRISLAKVKPISITLVVKNNGVINSQTRPASVIGMQNGAEVYNETLPVHDAVGNGRTKFDFPAFTPVLAGDIIWAVTIADDDPDVDEATAVTMVQ